MTSIAQLSARTRARFATYSRRGQVGIVAAVILATSATGATAQSFVSGTDILDNTITGRDVRNGSLTLSDLTQKSIDALQVPGATGPAGEVGETGETGAVGAKGSTGAAGPKGETGAAGPTGATGATGPTGETGAAGAIGAQGKTGKQGIEGATGEQGPQGEIGPQGDGGTDGENGADGKNGRTILNGHGAPDDADGDSGDFYLDTTSTVLYGPKKGEHWSIGGVALRGADGEDGQNGEDGEDGEDGTGSGGAVEILDAQAAEPFQLGMTSANALPDIVQFGAELADPYGAWDFGHRFTAPSAGLYQVDVQTKGTLPALLQLDVLGDDSGARTVTSEPYLNNQGAVPETYRGRGTLRATIKLAAYESFRIAGLSASTASASFIQAGAASRIKVIKLDGAPTQNIAITK